MKKIHVRKWLNEEGVMSPGGWIAWGIEPPTKENPYVYAYLNVADCNRVIYLDLDSTNENIAGTISKLSMLSEEIEKLKVNLLVAYDLQFKLEKEKAEKENAKR